MCKDCRFCDNRKDSKILCTIHNEEYKDNKQVIYCTVKGESYSDDVK